LIGRQGIDAPDVRVVPHGAASAFNPARPCGAPRRFAVPTAGFERAALCGLAKIVGTKGVTLPALCAVSTACGASNKGLGEEENGFDE